MNYLMLVCSEAAPIPPDADPDAAMEIDDWVSLCGESRVYGEALKGPDTARTVRVRNGETLVSDGPYTETKEFVAGFDLLDCEDLDAAIALAAAHPASAHRMCELRPFPEGFQFDGAAQALEASETGDGSRYLMMFCVDGIPEADDVEARIVADAQAWEAHLRAEGKFVFGNGLADRSTATTVRHRRGETLLADGPFVETKEFLAGVCVVRCAGMDEAIELTARMPLTSFHRAEVREMFCPADWADMGEEGR